MKSISMSSLSNDSLLRALFVGLCLAVAAPCLNAQGGNGASNLDLVLLGTIWITDGKDHQRLTITERTGGTFRARFEVGPNILRDLRGTVTGDKISWFAKDTIPIKGKAGHDNFGKLKGDSIDFVYRLPGESKDEGAFTMRLVRSSLSQVPAPRPLATIQTAPNQPRIDVLKDQAPNAVEWALAPLDQPLPPDIRQNLTYLREDLLDEAKAKPKASVEAYTLGSQLCDKILTAINARTQASAAAGYTAAQADAGVVVTSQALEARRNYMMSWPQYAREKEQRAEILRQQTSGADVKKERSKVDWAARADMMRQALDTHYRQLREAMR